MTLIELYEYNLIYYLKNENLLLLNVSMTIFIINANYS